MFRKINFIVIAAFAVAAVAVNLEAAEGQAKSVQSNIDVVAKSYLSVQKLLADDKIDGVAAELKKIREAADALSDGATDEKFKEQVKAVAKHAAAEPKDIKEAREGFKSLSAAVIDLVKATPPTTDAAPALYEATCPMAKANWLQASKDVANPYMGKDMLTCGTIEREIKPTARDKAQN